MTKYPAAAGKSTVSDTPKRGLKAHALLKACLHYTGMPALHSQYFVISLYPNNDDISILAMV